MNQSFAIRFHIALVALLFSVASSSAQTPVWQGTGTYPEEGGNYSQCAQSPDGTLYVASYGSGTYSSADDGQTWVQHITGLGDCTPASIAVAPNGWVYCVSQRTEVHPKVHRSTDGGDVWTTFEIDVANANSWVLFNVYVAGNADVYVTSNIGVLRSSDGGQHWTLLSQGMSNSLLCNGLGATGDGLVYTVKGDEAKLYLYNSVTQAWQTKGGIIRTATSGTGTQYVHSSSSFESKEIAVTVNAYPYIYRTTNLGASWDSLSYNLPIDRALHQCWALRYDVQGNLYCSVRNKGCYVLERNAKQWKALAVETTVSDCYDLLQTKSGAWISAGPGGLFRSTNVTKEWSTVKGTRYQYINSVCEFEGSYYSIFHGNILVSPTSSMDFTRPTGLTQQSHFWAMSTHAHRAMLCADSMYMSVDKGKSWQSIPYPVDRYTQILGEVEINDVGTVCYAVDASVDTNGNQIGHLYISDDKALQWKELALPDSQRTEFLSTIALRDKEIVLLDDIGRIVRCSDGQHFESFESGMPGRQTKQIIAMQSGDIYAIGSDGLFICQSGQNTWQKAEHQLSGFENPTLYLVRSTIHGALTELLVATGSNNHIAIAKQRGVWHDITGMFPFNLPQLSGAVVNEQSATKLDVFVSSYGMGMWTVTIDDVSSVAVEAPNSLGALAPQPTDEYATITLPVSAAEVTHIQLYSQLGSEVMCLSTVQAQQLSVDCRSIPNGFYTLRVTTASQNYALPIVVCHDCR